MKKFLIAIGLSLVLFTSLIAVSLFILSDYIYSPNKLQQETTVIIPKGNGAQVAHCLAEHGIINHPFLFRLYTVIKKQNAKLQAGEYLFKAQISPAEVLQKLTSGNKIIHKLTIIEGTTTKAIIRKLKKNERLTGEIKTIPEDGVLFPSTYCYSHGDSRELILQNILAEMHKKVNGMWEARSSKVKLKSHKEAMILASIIEKEAANDAEKPLVSAVFHNRLQKKMKLQADPTITYALMKDHKIYRRILTKQDLSLDSPYNTYKYRGLPPTPICNPGAKSIKAALHPADSDCLYFVSDGNRGHKFSRSHKEHAVHHNRLRQLRKEKEEKKAAAAKENDSGEEDE
jgi:UPF0755 protein